MSLFESAEKANLQSAKPLAARMRPQEISQFVGQQHILGEGKLLRQLVDADRIGSVIFYAARGSVRFLKQSGAPALRPWGQKAAKKMKTTYSCCTLFTSGVLVWTAGLITSSRFLLVSP